MVPNRAKHHIWFSQNLTVHHFQHKKKKIINGLELWQKQKKTILEVFWGFFPKMRLCLKNSTWSIFYPYEPLTSCKITEKPYKPFLRESSYWNTTDHAHLIGPFPPKSLGRKISICEIGLASFYKLSYNFVLQLTIY